MGPLSVIREPALSWEKINLAEGESVIRSDLAYRYHWFGVRVGDMHVTSARLIWIPRRWHWPSSVWEASRNSITDIVCQSRPVKQWAYTVRISTLNGAERFAIVGPFWPKEQIELSNQWHREIIGWLQR